MRKPWNEYFLDIAEVVSTRSTCPRAVVGAVLVKDRRILATGYNGAESGEPHCEDAGCDVVDDHCTRAIHAEINAIGYAARYGVSVQGATLFLFSTKHAGPCIRCTQALKAAGITEYIMEG